MAPSTCAAIAWLTVMMAQTAWPQTDPPDTAVAAIRPQTIRADMGFLADDLLEGRAPGTRGYDLGAAYVSSRFMALGLRPGAGNGSYLQDVTLRSMRLDEHATSLILRRPGGDEPLTLRQDFIVWPDPARASAEVEAPMVFVGYGITAPGQHHDDYAHLDARGKIVIALYGSPAFSDPSVKAHFSAGWVKRKNAEAHGAVGFFALYSPDLQSRYPFHKMAAALDTPDFSWLDSNGMPSDYFDGLKCSGFISISGADSFLAGTGHSTAAVLAAASAGRLRGFPIPTRAVVHTATQSVDVKSPNVIGILEGADPKLKNEYIVYSAHLDHLGVWPPVDGDSIYNGALDNASGVAAVLSVAEAFSRSSLRPRRSILFIAVTGEESGLLGSDYFARFPTVPATSIVADLNVDGGVPLWPVADINAFGSEHSTLRVPIRLAAERLHLKLSADLHPEKVLFIRSDQYSFVRQGIPSVFIGEGMQSSDASIDTQKREDDWEASRYHEPSDDMSQPNLDFESAATLAKVDFLAGWFIANDTQRPTWDDGDFFGQIFGRLDTTR